MTKFRLVLATLCLSSLIGCVYDPMVGYAGRAPQPPRQDRPDPYANAPDDAPPLEQAPAPAPPTSPGQYPIAERTAKPNEVISPYEPYNVIDITDFRSGQLARDPSNQKIFRVP